MKISALPAFFLVFFANASWGCGVKIEKNGDLYHARPVRYRAPQDAHPPLGSVHSVNFQKLQEVFQTRMTIKCNSVGFVSGDTLFNVADLAAKYLCEGIYNVPGKAVTRSSVFNFARSVPLDTPLVCDVSLVRTGRTSLTIQSVVRSEHEKDTVFANGTFVFVNVAKSVESGSVASHPLPLLLQCQDMPMPQALKKPRYTLPDPDVWHPFIEKYQLNDFFNATRLHHVLKGQTCHRAHLEGVLDAHYAMYACAQEGFKPQDSISRTFIDDILEVSMRAP